MGAVSRIVGIDLGTTNSAVAVVDAGFPCLIADRSGRRITPSVVGYREEEPLVGEEARRGRNAAPESTVSSVKRFMGRRFGELRDEEGPAVPAEGKGGAVMLRAGERLVSPVEVSAAILRHLRGIAEASLGEGVERAVITVPAYFNDGQRQATLQAGRLAGLQVERIINEPTAAALAYGLERLEEKSRVAVYDLGGGTFDLSILELHEGTFRVLSTHGNTRLGGDDIDGRLCRRLARRIADAGGPQPLDPLARSRLLEAAEAAKIRLSQEEECEILLPCLADGFDFRMEMRREDLESVAGPVVERTRRHCDEALSDAGIRAGDLDRVVLVGGQTRMPLVRRLVGDWFGCRPFEPLEGEMRVGGERKEGGGPVLDVSQHPDEAVARGAAIQGAMLEGRYSNVMLLDVTPLSLGIETFGGLMNVIIPRNTTIPVKAGETFTTAVGGQREVLIHLLQGERERARDNWSLGRFTIGAEGESSGVPRVGVQFEIDADGVLHVLARDIRSGRERVMTLDSAVDVGDEDVRRMVEESVEHAFEDLAARRWIEASLKAEETARATRSALEGCGHLLEEADRNRIARALEAVEAMRGEEGDGKELDRRVRVLDEETRDLAELQMQQVLDEMLRR